MAFKFEHIETIIGEHLVMIDKDFLARTSFQILVPYIYGISYEEFLNYAVKSFGGKIKGTSYKYIAFDSATNAQLMTRDLNKQFKKHRYLKLKSDGIIKGIS